METSCKSRINGSITLIGRQACTIESAARANPDMDINLLVAAPAKVNVSTPEGRYLSAILSYSNVKIYSMNVEKYLEGTPVEGLWKSGRLLEADDPKWRTSHLSDVLRYTTMWKYGGIYLDLDMMITQSLEGSYIV